MAEVEKRVCVTCRGEKPIQDFRRMGHKPGDPHSKKCRKCEERARAAARAQDREQQADPAVELARMRKAAKPSEAEWAVVLEAAGAIVDYLKAKAEGATTYKGDTAWKIVLRQTGDDHGAHRRFHQLIAMATVQANVWEREDLKHMTLKDPDDPRKLSDEAHKIISQLAQTGLNATAIAAQLGLSQPCVSRAIHRRYQGAFVTDCMAAATRARGGGL